jgi:transketolase
MTIVVPADGLQTAQAILAVHEHNGPVFVRLGRGDEHVPVYRMGNDFRLGRAITVREGSDITIISNGPILARALEAAGVLEKEGISCRVLDMHTVKPIDRDAIVKAVVETKGILTAEDHSIIGGLGSAVSEVLAEEGAGIKLIRLGYNDTFPPIGTAQEILAMCDLDGLGIAASVRKLLHKERS